MDSHNGEISDEIRAIHSEISEIIQALKDQAEMTQALRMTVPLPTVDKLHNLWRTYEFLTET